MLSLPPGGSFATWNIILGGYTGIEPRTLTRQSMYSSSELWSSRSWDQGSNFWPDGWTCTKRKHWSRCKATQMPLTFASDDKIRPTQLLGRVWKTEPQTRLFWHEISCNYDKYNCGKGETHKLLVAKGKIWVGGVIWSGGQVAALPWEAKQDQIGLALDGRLECSWQSWHLDECGGVSGQEMEHILKASLKLNLQLPVEAWKATAASGTVHYEGKHLEN